LIFIAFKAMRFAVKQKAHAEFFWGSWEAIKTTWWNSLLEK